MKRNRSDKLVTTSEINPNDSGSMPNISTIVTLREAVSRIPQYMRPMGSQHLAEYDWNEKHGCYNEDRRGYIDMDDDLKEDYEFQKKTMKKLQKLAVIMMDTSPRSDTIIFEMRRRFIKMVEGETSFGLIFSYGQLDVEETGFYGLETVFLRLVKSMPEVVYKIMPVLIRETHECTCEGEDSGEDDYDFENDCGCSCEVYSVSPEDINYTLNTKPKDRYMNHPHPFGGGNTRFYAIKGQGFGHAWDSKQQIDGVTQKLTYLHRAIVVTSFEASAHKKRKYAETGKAAKEK